MLGDTAVAVNAQDPRYFHLHGRTVDLPLMNRQLPVILDDLADPQFGTGAVKVTPAHDPNDFEAGKRHNLPRIKVIDENGRMTAEAGPYAGPGPLRGAPAAWWRIWSASACWKRSRLMRSPWASAIAARPWSSR